MSDVRADSIPRSTGHGDAEPSEQAAAATVLRMIQGLHISRAVHVAARLGIADLLEHGPRTCSELAEATQTHEASLYRILRLLAALGLFTEVPPGRFTLTSLGERLRTTAPASVRAWALLTDSLGGLRPFDHVLHTVRTGQTSFDAAFGVGTFEFLSRDPDALATFHAAMSERTATIAPTVAAGYSFSRHRTVVDVGGGRGVLLATILQAYPDLRGILLDLPEAVAGAEEVLRARGVLDRCAVAGGDFFTGVPPGADAYLLANVLHDWDGARAVEILARCRAALVEGGRVLVVERRITAPGEDGDPLPTLLSDINMLVVTGGRERTDGEYERLFTAAGLHLVRVIPVAPPYCVFEGACR